MRPIAAVLRCLFAGALALGFGAAVLRAQASTAGIGGDPDPWPRVFENARYTIRLFPPQVDSWDGSRLAVHCAVEVVAQPSDHPLYGVVRFSARTQVDKAARMVVVDEISGLSATFPSNPDREAQLLAFLQKQVQKGVRVVSLDRLEAALAVSGAQGAPGVARVENRAPRIVFSERPATLVFVDGEPAWRAVAGTDFERLLNTRPLVLRRAGTIYLHLFDGWLESRELAGPYRVSSPPPPGIEGATRAALAIQPADLLDGGGGDRGETDETGAPVARPTLAAGPVPAIVVATEPTELVVIDGAPEWTAVPGTALEFVTNTTGNLFRSGVDGPCFVLLSGRWFRAATLAGPWAHVPQGELAPDFARIPDDSPKENVKASVAGTAQAEEAVIANSIPETSEVQRAAAKFTPKIDGAPVWKPVDAAHSGPADLSYVENSPTPILRVRADTFYALDRGVWFSATAVAGPWVVAITVPQAIYAIPASSPLHYVTYVRIYGSTPTVVTVGYTPGYYGTVVADGVVVYGTGYVYSPWVGTYWIGAPITYGYGCAVTYTPWGGWAVAFGVGWAWGAWGGWYAPYYAPYWGGYYGWHGGVVVGAGGGWAAWGPGGWAGTTGNIYRQWGPVSTVSRYSGGYNAWTGNAWRAQSGIAYNSRTGGIAAGQRGAVGNVYTGEYAYGGRGVARTGDGNLVAGGRVTAGDVDTGREVTAGRVAGYDPKTGEGGSAAWVRGEDKGAVRVGDDYFGYKDGNVYRHDGSGGWSQIDRTGEWKGVQDAARTRDLDRQYQGRSAGAKRYSGQRPKARPAGTGQRP